MECRPVKTLGPEEEMYTILDHAFLILLAIIIFFGHTAYGNPSNHKVAFI
jgi:hypothetical protein